MQVARALNDIKEPLRAAGLLNSQYKTTSTAAKQRYDEFTGMFMVELQEFQQKNKRNPDEQENRAIAGKVLREIAPASTWFGSPTRAFEVKVPNEFTVTNNEGKQVKRTRTEVITFLTEQLKRPPTEGEIKSLYLRMIEK